MVEVKTREHAGKTKPTPRSRIEFLKENQARSGAGIGSLRERKFFLFAGSKKEQLDLV